MKCLLTPFCSLGLSAFVLLAVRHSAQRSLSITPRARSQSRTSLLACMSGRGFYIALQLHRPAYTRCHFLPH
ncbi:hypothetical protein BD414DRAFT_488666 [Trametes punicea]|nr:hypothetical protein BD414DRAFT_488666 [Trametes punicea]